MSHLPPIVRVKEIGPRDGPGAESRILPRGAKLRLIRRLADAGLQEIEATSLVSPIERENLSMKIIRRSSRG